MLPGSGCTCGGGERARSATPPPEAAALFGDLSGVSLLEVAAGTGLWTRFVEGLGGNVTAVEPDDAMRAVLTRRSPDVRALAAFAESLPFDDANFDAVLVSSAWHWFEQPAATNEIARVLRDEGRVFVLWNGFSRDVPWIEEIGGLRDRPDDPHKRPRGWRADFDDDGPFEDVNDIAIHWTRSMRVDDVVQLMGTFSGMIVRDEDDGEQLAAEVRRRLEGHSVDGVVGIPMTLRGTIARRRARAD